MEEETWRSRSRRSRRHGATVPAASAVVSRTGAACDDRRQLAPGELVLHDHPRDLRGDESPTSFERGWWLTALC